MNLAITSYYQLFDKIFSDLFEEVIVGKRKKMTNVKKSYPENSKYIQNNLIKNH